MQNTVTSQDEYHKLYQYKQGDLKNLWCFSAFHQCDNPPMWSQVILWKLIKSKTILIHFLYLFPSLFILPFCPYFVEGICWMITWSILAFRKISSEIRIIDSKAKIERILLKMVSPTAARTPYPIILSQKYLMKKKNIQNRWPYSQSTAKS